VMLVPSLFLSPLAAEASSAFIQMNVVLGVFNLVPALPMDGGRVLRGVLALKRDYLSATRIAVRIGRAIAIAGFAYAVYAGDFILGFIAVFVFFGAGTEERIALMREAARQGGGAAPGGPFGGVHTFVWTSGGGSRTAPATPRRDDEVIVIQGGKAEVISRKDPDERS
jgi:hypothetical protein